MPAHRGISSPPSTQDTTLPLRDAVKRALRGQQQDWTALALHLSRLAPPAPRPHHRRIARAVLDDAASKTQGQLFTLSNGDLVLLFPTNDGGVGLATTMASLFSADAPDPGLLLSRWTLPEHLEKFIAFLDALPTIVSAPSNVDHDSGLAAVTNLFNSVEPRRIRDLLLRQTGVLVTSAGDTRVLPVFREVRFSLGALQARAAASGHITADPYLFRHLIAKLDASMLAATAADLAYDRPLLAGLKGSAVVLHVNMSLEAVFSSSFDILAEAAHLSSTHVAVEIAILEAFADPDAFSKARARLKEAKFALVLDDVSEHALLVTKPMAFGFDWLKLEWNRQLLQSGHKLAAAMKAIDPERIILQQADTEEAVRWGLAHGLRRFQGRHADAILAAGRLATCHSAKDCTLRKCIEREGGATPASRLGCLNTALLDSASASAERSS